MIRLASSSQTRAKLLDRFGIEYIQSSVNFDEESIQSNSAREFVYQASKGKLETAIKKYGLDTPILTADTVIATSDDEILRKAYTIDEAREILKKQSGNTISIVSAIHLKSNKLMFIDLSATHYKFAKFDENDLQEYLKSGKWRGKAGACMVEGFCKKYILKVDGLESTAMGLQVEKILPWID